MRAEDRHLTFPLRTGESKKKKYKINFERNHSLSLLFFCCHFSGGEMKLTGKVLQAPCGIKYTVLVIMTSVNGENH